jgi:hypothetical protein
MVREVAKEPPVVAIEVGAMIAIHFLREVVIGQADGAARAMRSALYPQ